MPIQKIVRIIESIRKVNERRNEPTGQIGNGKMVNPEKFHQIVLDHGTTVFYEQQFL